MTIFSSLFFLWHSKGCFNLRPHFFLEKVYLHYSFTLFPLLQSFSAFLELLLSGFYFCPPCCCSSVTQSRSTRCDPMDCMQHARLPCSFLFFYTDRFHLSTDFLNLTYPLIIFFLGYMHCYLFHIWCSLFQPLQSSTPKISFIL